MLWFGCTQSSKEGEQGPVNDSAVAMAGEDLGKGFQLLQSSCFSCHSPDANIENKVAPTMAALKKHYVKEGVTKAGFTNAFAAFVNDPVEEKSIIPQATEQFGLMPKLDFSEEQLSQMAGYVYHTRLEVADWYAMHYEKEKQKHKVNLTEMPYAELGKHYAMSTKAVLGKNLRGAIKNKGTENAVAFCNVNAYPLTDSMAVVLNAKIKRVSDKPRNPLNAANTAELKYIDAGKQMLARGEKIKPVVRESNGKMVGYYPIVTNKMCLQCHGKPNKGILPGTLTKIKGLYPEDKATGYDLNELRGIWVVEMDKKED